MALVILLICMDVLFVKVVVVVGCETTPRLSCCRVFRLTLVAVWSGSFYALFAQVCLIF
jgi:hypothetical protein